MAKFQFVAASTSQTVDVFIPDTTSTTGGGKTGLVYNTSGLTCYYNFPRGTSTAVTLATLATANSAWSSGGFKEIDATNQPGKYRFDVPDALLASGNGRYVGATFNGATGIPPVMLEIELTAWNNQDAVRGGMTALPNAAAEAAGGLYTRGTGTGQINQDANGRVDTNLKAAAGTAVTLDANNVLNVSAKYWAGTAITATSLPVATSAGAAGGLLISGTNSGTTTFGAFTVTGAFSINGTSNVAQTGDSFARIGALGAGLTAVGDTAGTTTLLARWTATRAGYVDNLSAGAVALASGVTVTTNNDKTGYTLIQPFPSNFAALSITAGGIASSDVKYVNAFLIGGAGTLLSPFGP